MPRHSSPVWEQVNRESIDGKQHCSVTCIHCGHHWTSNQVSRIHVHLESCKELPRHLWEKYSPIRLENGGVAPEKQPFGMVRARYPGSAGKARPGGAAGDSSGLGDGDLIAYANGSGRGGGVPYATPNFATLLRQQGVGSGTVPQTKQELEVELLQLQIQRNEIERKELEIRLKLQQMT